jgi:hypothetical protein
MLGSFARVGRRADRGARMNMKRLRLALKQGGNPEYPTGTGSSVNLVYGLNPRQVETTSAGDAPQVSPTRECFARGIKTLYEMRGTGGQLI